MKTFTKYDYDKVKSEIDIGVLKEGNTICNLKDKEEYDENERLLKDVLNIEKYKNYIEKIQGVIKKMEKLSNQNPILRPIFSGSKSDLELVKLEAAIHIFETLRRYPWINKIESSNPDFILATKHIICVGFSILSHVFLEELGIKHYGLILRDHSALIVEIGGKEYYFDITNGIFEDITDKKKYYYGNLVIVEESIYGNLVYVKGDVEKILHSSIIHNIGSGLANTGQLENSISFYDKAVSVFNLSFESILAKGSVLFKLGLEEKFLEVIEDYLTKYPLNYEPWELVGIILFENGLYEEGIQCFNNSLLLNPIAIESLIIKSDCLFSLGKLDESLMSINKAIRLNPYSSYAWKNRALIVGNSHKDIKLCNFIGDLLNYANLDPNSKISLDNKSKSPYYRTVYILVKNKDFKSLFNLLGI